MFLPKRLKLNTKAYVLAFAVVASFRVHAQESDGKLIFTLSSGFTRENLSWSIAGKNSDGSQIDVVSELKWKKITGISLTFGAEYQFWKRFSLRANFSQAFISSGKVTDTDFDQDGRHAVVYTDEFMSNKGNIIGYHFSLIYKIPLGQSVTFSPIAGYCIIRQSLYILRDYGNVQGDLRSTYRTKWTGPLVGLGFKIPIQNKWLIEGNTLYHQQNYSAKANWNLVNDFKHPLSFKHSAKGFGLSADIGLQYLLTQKLSLRIIATYARSITGKGKDTLYRSSGDIVTTPLNPVRRDNLTFGCGLQARF